tara:strand:- start:275 stop:601 length:327 start_codon:yes stop_codon:yes gene_type:complete
MAWQRWFPTGIFAGITTNPTLLRRADQPCQLDHLKRLALKAEQLGCRELHLQAWGKNANELSECGTALAQLTTTSPNYSDQTANYPNRKPSGTKAHRRRNTHNIHRLL